MNERERSKPESGSVHEQLKSWACTNATADKSAAHSRRLIIYRNENKQVGRTPQNTQQRKHAGQGALKRIRNN